MIKIDCHLRLADKAPPATRKREFKFHFDIKQVSAFLAANNHDNTQWLDFEQKYMETRTGTHLKRYQKTMTTKVDKSKYGVPHGQ